MKNKNTKNFGIIALATIILISAIILEIALVTAFVVYTLNNTNYGSRLSSEALYSAQSGIDDMFLKLSRDKDFFISANPDYLTTGHVIAVGSRTAIITAVPAGGQVTITSEGIALNKHRKLQAVFNVDSTTGVVSVASQKELAF